MVEITIPLWGLIATYIVIIMPSLLVVVGIFIKLANERKSLKITEKVLKQNGGNIVVVKKEEKGEQK